MQLGPSCAEHNHQNKVKVEFQNQMAFGGDKILLFVFYTIVSVFVSQTPCSSMFQDRRKYFSVLGQ